MSRRSIFLNSLSHKSTERIVIDFGSTSVTGIHVSIVEKLREYYGLEKKRVKVTEPFQMLGEIEVDLMDAIGIDVIGLFPSCNMFGHRQDEWKTFKTFWGQEVLVPVDFNTKIDDNGDLLMFPSGDTNVPPSAKMPQSGFFFDALERQKPIEEATLNPKDNLEEFKYLTPEDIEYWKKTITQASKSDRGIIATFGGTAIGDIAMVPAVNLKNPKGIRGVTEWYMSTMMRPDYLHEVFEIQTDIALHNFDAVFKSVGNKIDAVFICGTDFGTQDSLFCGVDTFEELYAPYYRKMNNWIHKNTKWKTFKHSCGAVEPLMQSFIDCGFDIINPVQVNAKGMNPQLLKEKYGNHLVFWGGGADTQKILPFATPQEVREHVKYECELLSKDGGFVFNTVHNLQANTPIENVIAMIETVKTMS